MLTYIFTMTLVGIFAGILGALLGLGGGIVITPVLTLLFGVDIKYAVGASIIAVLAPVQVLRLPISKMTCSICALPCFWKFSQL